MHVENPNHELPHVIHVHVCLPLQGIGTGVPERVSHRTHAQHDVKVVANPVNKEGEHGVGKIGHTSSLGICSQSRTHL